MNLVFYFVYVVIVVSATFLAAILSEMIIFHGYVSVCSTAKQHRGVVNFRCLHYFIAFLGLKGVYKKIIQDIITNNSDHLQTMAILYS